MLAASVLTASALELLRRRYDGRFRQPAATAAGGTGTATAAPRSAAPTADSNGATADPNRTTADPNRTTATPRPTSERADPALRLTTADLGTDLGERATLVQFSSAFCAPCRAVRQLLGDIAAKEPGVAYAEIDAESHLDLVRRLHILRTPTVLVLDSDGRIATRASGLPRRLDVVAAVRSVCQFGVR